MHLHAHPHHEPYYPYQKNRYLFRVSCISAWPPVAYNDKDQEHRSTLPSAAPQSGMHHSSCSFSNNLLQLHKLRGSSYAASNRRHDVQRIPILDGADPPPSILLQPERRRIQPFQPFILYDTTTSLQIPRWSDATGEGLHPMGYRSQTASSTSNNSRF